MENPLEPDRPSVRVALSSRDQLIDATLRRIVSGGIQSLRLEDVLQEVGVTKGSLYWHFQDRDALIKAALEEQLRRLTADTVHGVSDAIATSDTRDSYIQRVLGYVVDPYDKSNVQSRWEKMELLCSTRRDPELSTAMSDIQSRAQAVFTDLMIQAQQSGILREDVSAESVALVLSIIALGSNLVDVLGDNAPPQEDWWQLMAFFIQTLFPDS